MYIMWSISHRLGYRAYCCVKRISKSNFAQKWFKHIKRKTYENSKTKTTMGVQNENNTTILTLVADAAGSAGRKERTTVGQ